LTVIAVPACTVSIIVALAISSFQHPVARQRRPDRAATTLTVLTTLTGEWSERSGPVSMVRCLFSTTANTPAKTDKIAKRARSTRKGRVLAVLSRLAGVGMGRLDSDLGGTVSLKSGGSGYGRRRPGNQG